MNNNNNNNIAKKLIEENNIKTFNDFQEVIEKLQSDMLQTLLDAELDCHLGYEKGSHNKKENDNRRNGYCSEKKVKTKTGNLTVKTPRDRNGTFEPVVIPKKQTMLDSFEEIAMSCYAKGMSLRDMENLFQDIYKVNFSKEQLSYLISKVNEKVQKWQSRKLKKIYTFVYIDCMYVHIKSDLVSEKRAVYVMIGIDIYGKKEVVGIWIGKNESTTYWINILEEIKERGTEEILFISMDGLTGLSEAIETVYSKTITQRCIVHLARNLYKICNRKEAKEILNDFKKIYKSANKEMCEFYYNEFVKKYKDNQRIVKKVQEAMPHIYSIMEYPAEIRKIIYTTNIIESVNSALRKVTRGKGSFPNEEAVIKLLYLRICELEKKWNKPISNWSKILLQLSEIFGERINKFL